MQNMNAAKMNPVRMQTQIYEAVHLLAFAAWAAEEQATHGRAFALEHPAGARSWRRPEIQRLVSHGALIATFDMCFFGLKSPAGDLMQKRTKVITNLRPLAERLSACTCTGDHVHQAIIGQQAGKRLSVLAQCYPPEFSAMVIECAHELAHHLAPQELVCSWSMS